MPIDIEQELSRYTPAGPTLLTIGVFDGVHLGHRSLLEYLVTRARGKGCFAGVITFKTHPEKVLNRSNTVTWICTLRERVRLLKAIGVDVVAPVTFTRELANLTAREFIVLLCQHLHLCHLVLGPDSALGKHREGTPEYLQKLGEELDFRVEVVEEARFQGQVISSSVIRQLIALGDIPKVEKMLGRRFSLEGRVVPGDRRGRTLGFPTANVRIQPEQAMPPDGIYATVTWRNGRPLASVTNIGVRPTFGGSQHLIETHIMDFDQNLYNKKLKIDIVARIRDERQFSSVEDLKRQLQKDVMQAREILAAEGKLS